MSKQVFRKRRMSTSSSSDSSQVEWSERKVETNDWLNEIESKCSENVKKSKKSEQKREQEIKDNRIRYDRELNPYFRNDVNKTFVEKPDNSGNDWQPRVTTTATHVTNSVSLTERNSINAKILKAEMLGNEQLVNQLKQKLQDLEHNQSNTKTHDNSVPQEYYSVKNKTKEDSMSLKEMFYREKSGTAEDENKRFIASSSKLIRNPDDEYEDLRHKNKKKNSNRNESQVRYYKSEDEGKQCKQCYKNIGKQLIVSKGDHTVVVLTPYEPFTFGYCYILSKYHSNVSTVSAEEDCLAEINRKKNEISRLFGEQKLSVVFMETYFKRKSFSNRHILIECVPIKKKLESEAKIFFKKAIMECEEEWSMNKKVIDINGKCVTKMIPKGLPYFWVTFGPKSDGFGHVIEDEELFPKNFGKEILGGLMDIEPNKWLKPKYQNYDQQYERVVKLKNEWKKLL